MKTTEEKTEIQHKDKLGRKLALGDFVVYPRRNSLSIGKITKMNPKMPRVADVKDSRREHNIYPNDMVLLDGPDVTFYILKHSA